MAIILSLNQVLLLCPVFFFVSIFFYPIIIIFAFSTVSSYEAPIMENSFV
jgi:hypothetical protein